MVEKLVFTSDTDVTFRSSLSSQPSFEAVHQESLSGILDITEDDDGEVIACEIDVGELVKAITVYDSMEELRYDWR